MSLRWMNEDHKFTLNQNADDKRHKKFLHSVHVFRCCVSKHTSDPDQRFTGFPWLEGITYILMSSMVISSFVTRLFFIIIIEVRLNVVENTLNDFISEKKVYLRLRFFFSTSLCNWYGFKFYNMKISYYTYTPPRRDLHVRIIIIIYESVIKKLRI